VNSLSRIPPSLAELPLDGNPLSYWVSTNSCSEPNNYSDSHRKKSTTGQPISFALNGNSSQVLGQSGRSCRAPCGLSSTENLLSDNAAKADKSTEADTVCTQDHLVVSSRARSSQHCRLQEGGEQL
jgi:hypothetical protein